MLPVLISFLASTIYQETPLTSTNPPFQESFSEPQNLEGLLLIAPAQLVKQATSSDSHRAYLGQVKTNTATTQIISVVVTDLDKIDPRPTPEEICDIHDRASRTRKHMAGQLFKTERTTINGKPMVILMGSLLSRNQTLFQTSAAFTTDSKAYEINWITLTAGETFNNAIKSIRSVAIQTEEANFSPATQIGPAGKYSLLGLPLNFQLPSPTEPVPDTQPNLEETARYIGEVAGENWYGTIEISQRKSPIAEPTPKNLLKLIGYEAWADLDLKFTLEKGIHSSELFNASNDRHARIDIALTEQTICAVIVSAPKGQLLPDRTIIGLFK